jgi:two-component system sensor histidine kinase ChiS
MTTLFSDIRGFTSMVEHMSPQENFAFINEYLGYMEPAIYEHGGFIDKYIGDAVMALFDDGPDAETGALRGVRAAVAMQRGVDAFNAVRHARGEPALAIGLGLHTGSVMLGTIGGRDRLNASVIGDAVNLASRVEGMTKIYRARILITETTADALPADHGFRLRVLDQNAPVTVLEVLDSDPPEQLACKLRTLPTYQLAWDHYQAGRFAEAKRLLASCGAETAGDAGIARLSERCDIMLRQGAPARWDGAITLTEK